jgi:hypothetical protein
VPGRVNRRVCFALPAVARNGAPAYRYGHGFPAQRGGAQ